MYTWAHRNDGQSRVTFDMNFFLNSRCFRRPTDSWIRSRRRPHQLPVGVENISNFFKNFHVESDATVRHFDGLRYHLNASIYQFGLINLHRVTVVENVWQPICVIAAVAVWFVQAFDGDLQNKLGQIFTGGGASWPPSAYIGRGLLINFSRCEHLWEHHGAFWEHQHSFLWNIFRERIMRSIYTSVWSRVWTASLTYALSESRP